MLFKQIINKHFDIDVLNVKKNSYIYYGDTEKGDFPESLVSLSDFLDQKSKKIAIKASSVFHQVSVDLSLKKPLCQSSSANEKNQESVQPELKAMKRRNKERKIGYVVRKVSEWRKLYFNESNEKTYKTISCKEAADIVGICKKSLDDYLMHIK